MSEEQKDTHTQRDGETLLALGIFLVVLGLPVMVGTLWADTSIQRIVCALAGIVIFGIGAAMAFHGKRVLKRLH